MPYTWAEALMHRQSAQIERYSREIVERTITAMENNGMHESDKYQTVETFRCNKCQRSFFSREKAAACYDVHANLGDAIGVVEMEFSGAPGSFAPSRISVRFQRGDIVDTVSYSRD